MQSPKERVYAAAEEISAERRPTVSTVRAAAGVSNADATRYLKEWATEKAAAGSQVAATPPSLLEAASRLAGALWNEASTLAANRHAGIESTWAQEKHELTGEVAELAADLDRLTEEKDTAVKALEGAVSGLQSRLQAAEGELAVAVTAGNAAAAAVTESAAQLAVSESRANTLQAAYDALLAKVAPPAKPKG